jgi:hypothetical protein
VIPCSTTSVNTSTAKEVIINSSTGKLITPEHKLSQPPHERRRLKDMGSFFF